MGEETAYESEWDAYSDGWERVAAKSRHDCRALGDEWGTAHLERYPNFVRPHIQPTDTVLEIGCGGGRLTELLIDDCSELICIDVSIKMLERMQRRFQGRTNLKLVKGNGMDLGPIPDRSVDCVVSYDVFVHIEPEDIYAYLIESRRVLRPGGRGIIHFSNILSGLGFKRFQETFAQFRGGQRHAGKFSCMTTHIMEKMLDSLNMRIRFLDDHQFHLRDALVVFEVH
jgi:ubiquinone/menaquinone biosynthesis C-methylase UbiE